MRWKIDSFKKSIKHDLIIVTVVVIIKKKIYPNIENLILLPQTNIKKVGN
jgi:hypothetical protein